MPAQIPSPHFHKNKQKQLVINRSLLRKAKINACHSKEHMSIPASASRTCVAHIVITRMITNTIREGKSGEEEEEMRVSFRFSIRLALLMHELDRQWHFIYTCMKIMEPST